METEGRTGGNRGSNWGTSRRTTWWPTCAFQRCGLSICAQARPARLSESKHHGELPNAASKDGRRPSAADDPKSHHFMRPKMSAVSAVPHLGRGKLSGQPIGRSRPSYATARAARPRPRPPACPARSPVHFARRLLASLVAPFRQTKQEEALICAFIAAQVPLRPRWASATP